MKKIIKSFIIMSIMSMVFVSCGSKNNNAENQDKKGSLELSNNVKSEDNKTEESKNTETYTNATVKVYEEAYMDLEKIITSGIDEVRNIFYYEVVISNVTDSSFDFTINNVEDDTQLREEVFPKSTAKFIKNGDEAVFYGDNNTLYFEFPNERESLPDVVEMKIKGLDIVEGISFLFNGVPGKEFN